MHIQPHTYIIRTYHTPLLFHQHYPLQIQTHSNLSQHLLLIPMYIELSIRHSQSSVFAGSVVMTITSRHQLVTHLFTRNDYPNLLFKLLSPVSDLLTGHPSIHLPRILRLLSSSSPFPNHIPSTNHTPPFFEISAYINLISPLPASFATQCAHN